MEMSTITKLLKEVESLLPAVTNWERRAAPDDCKGYSGSLNGFMLLVINFPYGSHGFAVDPRGHEGTVNTGGLILRMPREFAGIVFATAEAYVERLEAQSVLSRSGARPS